ncbi:MAG: PilN domain-containing protein [Pseudomonadota bacterium]
MPNQHLGIDIHPDGIKLVLLSSRLKSATVAGHWSVDYPDGQYSPENLAAALMTIADTADIEGCECAVSIPASWVYLRQAVLPFKEKKKIDQILSFEMEPLLPVATDGVLVDYQITATDAAKTVLMTAAVDKARLTSVIERLGTFKLNPSIFTLYGCPSLVLLQQYLKPEGDSVFVVPTATDTTVFLFSEKQVILVRCLPQAIASSPPHKMATDIQRVIFSFQDGKTGARFIPERLFLSASSEIPATLPAALSDLLGIPVELFHSGRVPSVLSIIDSETPPLESMPTDALALAVCSLKGFKGLNFRKGPFAVSRFWQENRKSLIAPAVISLLILLTAGYRSIAAIHDYQSRLEGINREITQTFKAALPDVNRIVKPIHQMRTKLAEMKQEAPQFSHAYRSRSVVDMLRAISERIPADADVVLNQMVIGPDAVLLGGDTDTFNTVNTVQQRLEQDPTFTSVSISSANQQKSGNRVNFKIRIQL